MTEEDTEDIEKELENLSPEDKKIVYDEMQRVFGQDKIGNIHEFLTKVIQEQDALKISNLSDSELGNPHLTFRTYKVLQIMAKTFDMPEFSQYFEEMANMIGGSSLSKNGFLILAAITEKRKLEAKVPSGERKPNKGMFGWRSRQQPNDYG